MRILIAVFFPAKRLINRANDNIVKEEDEQNYEKKTYLL